MLIGINSEATIETIADRYKSLAGNITDKNQALDILDDVFKIVAEDISNQPNGIVIDIKTGNKNQALSEEQSRKYSMDDVQEHTTQAQSQNQSVNEFSNFESKIGEEKLFTGDSKVTSDYFQNRLEEYARSNYTEETKSKINNKVNTYNMSDKDKDLVKKSEKNVRSTDHKVIKLIDMLEKLSKARGTPEYNIILEEFNGYLDKNPKDREKISELLDENGNVKEYYSNMNKDYKKDAGVVFFFNEAEHLLKQDPENISKEDKKELTIRFLSVYKFSGKNNELHDEIWDKMEKFFPEFNIRDENKKVNKENFYNCLEQNLELKEPLDRESFQDLLAISEEYMLSSINEKGLSKFSKNKKISDKDMGSFFNERYVSMNVNEMLANYEKSSTQKFFEGSNIKFDEKNEKELKNLYYESNSEAWISSKEEAKELAFFSLIKLKEELNKCNDGGNYYKNKLNAVDNKLKKFKSFNKDFKFERYLTEDGKLLPENEEKFEVYQRNRVNGKLLKEYFKSAKNINSYEDYNKLSKSSKESYLLNTMFGLEYMEKNQGSSFGKFAARRLEIIGSEANSFVSFKENGNTSNIDINKEQILKEYNKLSSHKFNTYEELSKYCNSKKIEYVSMKLEQYSNLNEGHFFELDSDDVIERSNQIERIKVNFNKKQLENSRKLKEVSMEKDLKARRQFKTPTITGAKINPKTASDIDVMINASEKTEVDDMNIENNIINSDENTQKDINNELVPIEKKKNILGKILEKITEISTSVSSKARKLFSKKTTGEGEENGTATQEETSVSSDWLPKEKVDTREAVKKTMESAKENEPNRESKVESIEFE